MSERPVRVLIDRVAVRGFDVPGPAVFAEAVGRELERALLGWDPARAEQPAMPPVPYGATPEALVAHGVAARLRRGGWR